MATRTQVARLDWNTIRTLLLVPPLLLILLVLLLLLSLPLLNNSSIEGADMFRLANKRPLKFAGSWYEADPKKLGGQLDGFDSAAKAKVASVTEELNGKQVLAIVAPHAGYSF